jgi:hypothetical protein
MATISWYLFERPINNLKKYFPYKKPPVTYPNEGDTDCLFMVRSNEQG